MESDNSPQKKLDLFLFSGDFSAVPPEASAFATKRVCYGPEVRLICLVVDVPPEATSVSAFFASPARRPVRQSAWKRRRRRRRPPAPWEITDIEVLSDGERLSIDPGEGTWKPIDFSKVWNQVGSRVEVTWLGNTFYAELPCGFDLQSFPQDKLRVVEDLLFGNLEWTIFGRERLLGRRENWESFNDLEKNRPSKVLIGFSGGEDSTAALRILPGDNTVPYQSQRAFSHYFRANGEKVILPSAATEERAMKRVASLVRVPTTFELIGLSIGTPVGYRDNFGYAAIGVFLSEVLDANTIAFGSVMEQVFMKSGNNFTDIISYPHARFAKYRDLLASVGIYFALPTGALSEVITNRICALNRDRYKTVSCPKTSEDGVPCGECFKCFRKMRLDGKPAPPPNASVSCTLEKRPLKSGTSVVFAVQKAGYDGLEIAEYLNVDLDFLTRYFGYGLRNLVPPDIAPRLEAELHSHGVEEMSDEDELKLRRIAQVFDPANYSLVRAGVPGDMDKA